jgi:PAS domain S-box-containing protein
MATTASDRDPAPSSAESIRKAASGRAAFVAKGLSWPGILVAAANAFLLLVAGLPLLEKRVQDERSAASHAEEIAAILESNLAGIIARADLALQAVTDEAERQLAEGAIDKKALDRFIVRQHSRIPEILTFRAADSSGMAIYGAEVPVATTRSLAHRDYFAYLRDNRVDELVFSGPLVGGITGKWMILLVRRIDGPDASFAGLAYAGLDLGYLTAAFSSFDVGGHGSIELRDRSLGLVFLHPGPKDPSALIGSPPRQAGLSEAIRATPAAGTRLFDGEGEEAGRRLVAYRRIGAYPYYILVGLDGKEYLAGWRTYAAAVASLVLLFLLASVAAALAFRRGVERRRRSALALAEQEEKFRLVAEYTFDWEFWLSPEGGFVYTSPSCQRITGHAACDFYADPGLLEKLVHPADLESYRAYRHGMGAEQEESELVFRITRADGEVRWLEQRCQPVASSSGSWLGTRGSNRDITGRVLAEERIRALLEEKELILREAHHRIKNNMAIVSSLLDLQADLDESLPPGEILRKAANRVKSMGLLYDKLYRSSRLDSLSLREYLEPLLREIHATFANHEEVRLDLDLDEPCLDAERLSSLGLLFNELIANSMKHAFPDRRDGELKVAVRVEGGEVRMEFSDNGVGLPAPRRLLDSPGFGMVLIESLVKKLKARMTVEEGHGLTYRIIFAA